MPYLDGRAPIVGITSFGQVDQHRQESSNLFNNFWTAKEFIVPGEGLQNNAGEGWIGGVSQVQEIGNYPLTQPYEQTSTLNILISEHLIKEPVDLPPVQLRSGQIPGVQATFYPKELIIDYGAWMTQIYKDGKGISAFTYLGNNMYQVSHFPSPQNVSLDKLGSTVKGLIQDGLLKP
jgi:hypothetical protein